MLIHYGGQSAVRSGVLDRVKKSLDEAGIFHVELGGVVPNPHLAKVREGIELSKANGVDFLLAVGGGSVIDSCKAIAYGLAEPEHDVWELYAGQRKAKACFPVASVLTIAAAGSEMSNSCVITNTDTEEKRAYNDDLARPKFAIMDPELTMTLPDYQTEAGCADIMMHTMERYFVKQRHDGTDRRAGRRPAAHRHAQRRSAAHRPAQLRCPRRGDVGVLSGTQRPDRLRQRRRRLDAPPAGA